MNTIPKIVSFDTCITETEDDITNRVRTEPVISTAFIENARDMGKQISEDVLRTRIIDLCKTGVYTRLQIFDRCYKGRSSGEAWKYVSREIDGLLEGDIIIAEHGEYATKYTLSQIRDSAIEEIRNRGDIVEEYKRWIPLRWR